MFSQTSLNARIVSLVISTKIIGKLCNSTQTLTESEKKWDSFQFILWRQTVLLGHQKLRKVLHESRMLFISSIGDKFSTVFSTHIKNIDQSNPAIFANTWYIITRNINPISTMKMLRVISHEGKEN